MSLKNHHMKPAFSMITAIIMIVLMSTVAIFVMNIAGKVTKETTSQYQKEQAILYAKSYTEYAIMAAGTRDCINQITAFIGNSVANVNQGDGYDVQVDIQYIGNELTAVPSCNTLGLAITEATSRGSIILIDVYIKYRDRDTVNAFLEGGGAVTATNLPWITYHRRTLQRL